MDLFNDINDLIKRLNTSVVKLRDYGKELAEAERDYKITLRQEALKLRIEQDMPVTLINQIIYGIPNVADKRFKRDVAETMYCHASMWSDCRLLNARCLARDRRRLCDCHG